LMAHYIYLAKLTQQGNARIHEIHTRWEQFIQLLESRSGKFLSFYATLGPYDYIVIVDLPSDVAALEVSLAMARKGNVTFETCRAFDYAQFAKAVESTST
ncbi:MAG: hypothetical protein DMG24_18630, partial [Acidobacteria bacterium]